MGNYLDFDNEKYQKGYKEFQPSDKNFKDNIGKKICFLLSRDFDRNRGYMVVRHGKIIGKRYSQLYINENHDSIDVRDVLEWGIQI